MVGLNVLRTTLRCFLSSRWVAVVVEDEEVVASDEGGCSRCCWAAEEAVVRLEVGTGATDKEDSVSGRVAASVGALLLVAGGRVGLATSCLAADEMKALRGGLLARGGGPTPPADLA